MKKPDRSHATRQKRSYFHKEEEILNKLQQVTSSTGSGTSKGTIFEDQFASLLTQILPNIFTIHRRCKILDQFGQLSREADIVVTDSRFPILAFNEDKTKLLPFESIIALIELKSTLDKSAIYDLLEKAVSWSDYKIQSLKKQQRRFRLGDPPRFWSISLSSSVYIKTALKHIHNFSREHPCVIETNHYVLRLKAQEWPSKDSPIGSLIWWEGLKQLWWNKTDSPLSDFMMMLFEELYSAETFNSYDFEAIRMLMYKYMPWGSLPLEHQRLK